MSKFIGLIGISGGLNAQGYYEDVEISVIVNIDDISFLAVETQQVCFRDGRRITLNSASTKVLLEILMESEYKMEVKAE